MTRLLSSPTLIVAMILALAGATAATLLVPQRSGKTITAYFTEAPGLYAGDSVRVLGVEVGKIESVTAESGRTKIVLHYDDTVRVPAGARAAIVSPSLVGSRFVQLTPAYTAGPALPDDATIPLSHTATPVEWDTTVKELTELTSQLGPGSGEASGALGRLLDTTQANLDDQGGTVHDTIRNAADAMTTLAAGGEDLFGTIRNLRSVVTNLALNDSAVEAFSEQLTQISSLLATNREQLASVVRQLDQVAAQVQTFVKDNKDQLSTGLHGLSTVVKQVADNRQALANFLQKAPVGVSNLNNNYDPTGSLMPGAFALSGMSDPATYTCSLIFAAGGRNDNTNAACEAAIAPFVQLLKMNNVPLLANPLQTQPAHEGGGR